MPDGGAVSNIPPGGSDAANLEIHISRRGIDQYAAELRYTPPGNEADTWFPSSQLIRFTPQVGTDAEIDPKAVGRTIADDLCADPVIAKGFAQILAVADSADTPLQVRLFIDPGATELQVLPWETMAEPGTDRFLFAGERRSFSRFLAGSDFSHIEPRSQPFSRAALIVANPPAPQLDPFDVQAQLALAREALAGLDLSESVSGGAANLKSIVHAVQEGNDLVYLVAHGSIRDGQAWLWLESPEGGLERVPVEELIDRLQELRRRPRLFVLFSCRSSGDDAQFHAALGPRLAAIGVPAVLAMRGDVPIAAAGEFLAAFFRELRENGSLDRAVAVARRAVTDEGAAWIPVLFTRLRSGRIWYRPGFARGGGSAVAERWPTLLGRIRAGRCTPILGPQLTEPIVGSFRDIALQWSQQFSYPLAPQDREKLTSVAQYVATNQDTNAPRDLFEDHIRRTILANFKLAPEFGKATPIAVLLRAAWQSVSGGSPFEPHRVLARLPFPIYLTTNTNLLLEEALREAGRKPQSELYAWNNLFSRQSVFERDPGYVPTVESPLAFHLFGHMEEPDAGPLLTEDDYFDYLIQSAINRDRLPPKIRASLYNSVLLFLGFQIDDWGFRVLFRSLINHENVANLRRFSHIAVQVDPEEGRILEPGRARRYLESYFDEIGNISIFWGSAEEFARELGRQWDASEALDEAS